MKDTSYCLEVTLKFENVEKHIQASDCDLAIYQPDAVYFLQNIPISDIKIVESKK